MSEPKLKLVAGSIDVHVRRKRVYERHQSGETYAEIAKDLGVSVGNACALSKRWKLTLENFDRYLSHPDEYSERGLQYVAAKFKRLSDAGLLSNGKRSPEYGYA